MLKYKAELREEQLVKIDKFYLLSKTCSICVRVKEDFKVSNRLYTCECSNLIDRDLNNISINMKNQGRLLFKYQI